MQIGGVSWSSGVLVTGAVPRPGRYAGIPSDSALVFLDQAGGIDARTGSYRHVQLLRGGQVVAELDLYDFLLRGTLPTQVKIGPPEKIRDLVMTMVPGVRIEPIEAPRQIPYHANYTYFQLDPRSEFWSPIELSRRLALYVAGDLPGLDLQMWAIRQ